VTHSPHPSAPSFPSFFDVSVVVVGLDGEIEPGTMLTMNALDTQFDPVVGPIGPGGVVSDMIVPIDHFGSHSVSFEINGAMLTGSGVFVVEVDAAEGPVGGCTPADQLDDAARAAAVNALLGEASDSGVPNGQTTPPLPAAVVPDPIPAPEDDLGPYREFFTRFATAHRDGDTGFLIASLHPAVIARYGAAQCEAYVDSIVGTLSNMRVVDGMSEPWDFPLDDRTAEIPGAVSLDVDALWDGEQFVARVHVAPVDDDLAWFADCGEPL